MSDNRSFICKMIKMVYIYGLHIYIYNIDILYNHKSIDGMYPLVMTHGLLENQRTKKVSTVGKIIELQAEFQAMAHRKFDDNRMIILWLYNNNHDNKDNHYIWVYIWYI